MSLFLIIVLMSCWNVAASLVAQYTNAGVNTGVTVFVAEINSNVTCRHSRALYESESHFVSVLMELLPSFLLACPLLQSSVYLPLSSDVGKTSTRQDISMFSSICRKPVTCRRKHNLSSYSSSSDTVQGSV